MDAVETAHSAKLRALAGLDSSCIAGRPNSELAAFVSILLGATLQTQLVLI